MEKSKFAQIAEVFGFKVNEESIEVVTNEYDMDKPENWDEMSEEDQMAWKKKHEVMANAEDPPKPAAKPQPAARQTQPAPVPDELVELNQLIKDMGGMPAFKGLLLNAVEAVEGYQKTEEQERKVLVSAIVANSSSFKAEDLKEMDTPILKKLAEGMIADNMRANVDWRMTGSRTLTHNQEEDVAAPPAFLLAKNKEA